MASLDQYLEEKTPKGFTLKILVKKGSFLVFDRVGATVYGDPGGMKVLHRIPVIAFLGSSFTVRNRRVSDFTLCKVSKGKIVVPFYISGDRDMRYLLVDTIEPVDMMPVRITFINSVAFIAREIEAGARPDVFVVDKAFNDNDLVVIKNRVPTARVFLASEIIKAGITVQKEFRPSNEEEPERAIDVLDTVNLNVMSNNPVFLARVHLRQLDLSKVRQLLFDFDMTPSDAGFIQTFIDSMLKKIEEDPLLATQEQKLADLREDFVFYTALLAKKTEDVTRIIESITDMRKFSSYMTLIAKARSMCFSQNDLLEITEYENLLLEKKESLQG
ncbi:MAG TPA: hypothetical protein VF857_10310 [Spirochaetota bacterium]